MKIALVPLNPTVGDVLHNAAKVVFYIKRAIDNYCSLIIFPELALTGYPPKDYLYFDCLHSLQSRALTRIKGFSKKIPIVIGGVKKNKAIGRPFFNTAYVFFNGQVFTYAKQLLPNYDVFDECRWFEPGHECLKLKLGGRKFGLTICEDIWFKEAKLKTRYHRNPLKKYKLLNLDFLINISASPYEINKPERRQKILADVARELKTRVIYLNQSGANDDLIFDGGSLIFDKKGEIIFSTPPFTEDLFIYDSEEKTTLQHRDSKPIVLLHEALVIGIRDYFLKTAHSRAVIGLSGGIDSALVACLAVSALGAENVLGILLPSKYSSKHSMADAFALAKNLNIPTRKISIVETHEHFTKLFSEIFPKGVSDITDQNIQARIRANILMAIANNESYLLLNNTNKSELAMGYGTLYGDMGGALAVISDLTKKNVYELSRYINREREIIPKNCFTKPPSAELKEDQRDDDTLPPYKELDPLVERVIEQRKLDVNALNSKAMRSLFASEYKRHQAPLGLKVTEKAFGSGRRIPIVGKIRNE